MKLEELRKIREKAQQELGLREGKARIRVIIGMGTSGIAAGARETLRAFLAEIENRNLTDVLVTQTGEKGLASQEPVVVVEEPGKPRVIYGMVTPEVAKRIVAEHIVNGVVVSEYVVQVEE
ncbi:MAG: (2Fe-2S) ferredoxin domain-containing protein [Caldiserica bacterium]|jgi:(2Fe-2S) ferredoxin|nr:(2Fe-2S) ferredoxin domain-containing protein [Caldisericota bacterium]MDH7562078.1 (2Fe-2S) ferredoxin domain-containing protein [Caldisericota bacterium]